MHKSDKDILRQLANNYLELCNNVREDEKRDLWRAHNSFDKTAIPILVRAFAWDEMPQAIYECKDSFYHPYEKFFRQSIFRARFEDDYIFEPWITVNAVYSIKHDQKWGGPWGLPVKWVGSDEQTNGSKVWDPPLKNEEDIEKLTVPQHCIDEQATKEKYERIYDAIGDIIEINLDRSPLWREWNGDISTQLVQMRGLEQVMLDMVDRPEWLHDLLSFMRDGILKSHEQAEQQGDWSLAGHINQAMPYAKELPDPIPNSYGIKRKQLWNFCASQELTLVGPAMFEEFMLQYQIPIVEKFGLVAYGCCEDLTKKIDSLRKIPNLRRIAVAPAADVEKCAQQIGSDYILSYRPSPADMVGYDFDHDRIRTILGQNLDYCRDCCLDITLKDVQTVQGDPDRIKNWIKIARSVTENPVQA